MLKMSFWDTVMSLVNMYVPKLMLVYILEGTVLI